MVCKVFDVEAQYQIGLKFEKLSICQKLLFLYQTSFLQMFNGFTYQIVSAKAVVQVDLPAYELFYAPIKSIN